MTPTVNDGHETITTGSGRDIIFTGNGDNTVHAGAGNDDVIGGDRIDALHGEAGDDWLVGNRGDDVIDGGAGDDVMFGGTPVGTREDFQLGTSDFVLPPEFESLEAVFPTGYLPAINITPAIFGGQSVDGIANDGRDILSGQSGNDIIVGGSGVDELYGGSGTDYLDAGVGDDRVVQGGAGDDVVRGGSGNDLVHGDQGIDHVLGDDGDDDLFADEGNGADQAGQRLIGGDGRDSLFAYAPAIADLNEFNAQAILVGDQLFGGSGGDFLHGNARMEIFDGGAGNDFIAADEFVGSGYEPHFIAAIGTEADVHGADDTLLGGSGEDQLYGGGGNDLIWGGAVTDYIDGQQGSDIQYGGSGIDLFVLPTTLGSDGHIDPGTDTIDGHFGNAAEGDEPDDNATDILTIDGTTGNDTILLGQIAGQGHVLFNGIEKAFNIIDGNGTPWWSSFASLA